jgi:dTDP-4-amino-4,6-dideoxygalactose transaminase
VIGSQWHKRNVGAFGDLVTFSFHPNKNVTSIEGGALVVNDASEARRVEVLRFHGIEYQADRTRDVAFPGGKFNMPDVNARIGREQLQHLSEFLTRRRALADRYFAQFATDPPCILPPKPATPEDEGYSWNMFCVLLPLDRLSIDRKQFRDALEARGIGTGMSYEALHLCTLGRKYGGHEGQFPNTERISRETVSLPLHAGMTDADVDRVCAAAAEVIAAEKTH